ncbi:MAG: hypothetical protein HY591_00555 [Candidatus Omnitrophica bacterium]|nr:hypothetical protein [Candidatus Omnitrophota bacterium]
MNRLQFGLFFIYVLSMLSAGMAWRRWLSRDGLGPNRVLFAGESLLLGSIIIVGQMLVLSLLHLYKAPWLWLAMLSNFLFLLWPPAAAGWKSLFGVKVRWDVPLISFAALLGIFMFRNCYFLVDVDSHSTYLYAQKLWLEHGTSIFASPALDVKVFVPHFNAVPYALGLSVFPGETLFPQLVVAFWTVITVLLIFGYVGWRSNRFYALAASMMVVFNDHVFFSGANAAVIINSALAALFFAAAYNIWEGRPRAGSWRFVLALVFLAQFVANKYPMAYVMVMLLGLGLWMRADRNALFRQFLRNGPWLWSVALSAVICGLWFLKNYLATGCPTFPVLAGQMNALNWDKEMADIFNKAFVGPLNFAMIIKYLNYLFIWPGIHAAKIVIVSISFMPLIFLMSYRRGNFDERDFAQWSYWLGVSLIAIVGMSLVTFVDPRHYRYGIGVMAVAAVWGMDYVLRRCLGFNAKWVMALVIVAALPGWQIIWAHGGSAKYPSFRDNAAVILDRMHMKDAMRIHYPDNAIVLREWPLYADKFQRAAWDAGVGGVTKLSAFLLPVRPQVGLWYTTAVRWDSYGDPSLVARDLSTLGIDWVMTVKDGHLVFVSALAYGQRASGFDKHPRRLFYDYGFPAELSNVRY